MNNNWTDYQKQMFFEIYKTSLGAFLSKKEFGEFSIEEIRDAAKVAMNTVDLLTNGNDLRKHSEIVDALENREHLSSLDFPKIEE